MTGFAFCGLECVCFVRGAGKCLCMVLFEWVCVFGMIVCTVFIVCVELCEGMYDWVRVCVCMRFGVHLYVYCMCFLCMPGLGE